MDNALQSLQSGNLKEALAQVKERVRNDPANTKERIFLFQLFIVLGDWEKAQVQLNVIGELDDAALPMVQTYREALKCEQLRSEIFSGKQSPLIFGDPEQWIAEIVEATKLLAGKHFDQSKQLRESAFEAAPTTSGTIDGKAFSWIADADSRFGPILEAIINGRYYWVPFNRVARIQIEEPCDLRDAVWMPSYFTWANGGECVALIPTRYPGAETSDDIQTKLAKKTTWLEESGELYLGQGQRLLATDVGEFPLMDIRDITLDNNG